MAVIYAWGHWVRKSARTGVAITKSPSQLGMRTMIFLGVCIELKSSYILAEKADLVYDMLMNSLEQLISDIPLIEARIGYIFKNKQLLALAFVHCSYTNEHRDIQDHNERLEFLGDAVLGMLVAE